MATTNGSRESILVIGTGLIGTSIAMGLHASGHPIFLQDSNIDAQATAIAKSGGQEWDGSTRVDVVVVATPPAVTASVIAKVLVAQPNAVVTDVSSVKGSVFAQLADVDPKQLARFVGGHPMAGREVAGASSAQSNLFVDRPWVITKHDQASEATVATIRALITELGAVPIERSVDDHDRAVAIVSHAPQIVASVLAAQLVNAQDSDVALAGQGLRDTTRIASSDSNLWSQILMGNAKEVSQQISEISERLSDVAQALSSGDESVVRGALVNGVAGRDRLPGKHGAAKTDSAIVEVRLEDKPGELARLFAVAAQANVNLEDVRIDHSLGRMTGLVELTVAVNMAQALHTALAQSGFVVVS